MTRIVPFVLILLALSTIYGATWDIWSHDMGFVETFWTTSHGIIYISVALTGIVVLAVVIQQSIKIGSFSPKHIPYAKGYALSGSGSLFQLLAGVSDDYYHSIFGFDVTMWSPPHVGVIFGAVLTMVGVFEMLAAEKDSWKKWAGTLLSLSLAIVMMQIVLIEYSFVDDFSLTERWQAFNAYVSILMSPVMVYCFTLGAKRLSRPVGSLISASSFCMNLCIYYWWNSTPSDFRFPLMLFISGLLFDAAYIVFKNKKFRSYAAGISAVIGLEIAQMLQNPLSIKWDATIFSIIISFLLGLLFVSFSENKLIFKNYHVLVILMIWVGVFVPETVMAHGEDPSGKVAPELHPSLVLLEFLIIFFLGYLIATALSRINMIK
ncbi:hypothetical protein [Paenibacillus sp. MMO-58]|uniref:hypothetical protein n=1 Tax=Paenibacillus sp. MMO-58 TaxID=3081290 RepID=UPI0030187D2B